MQVNPSINTIMFEVRSWEDVKGAEEGREIGWSTEAWNGMEEGKEMG